MEFRVSESWGYHFGGPQKKDAYVEFCFGVPCLWQLPLKVFGLGFLDLLRVRGLGIEDWALTYMSLKEEDLHHHACKTVIQIEAAK